MTEFADDAPLRAPCDHTYDVDCMIEFFRAATTDDLHFPPRCCGREIPLYDVRDILPDELVARYLHRADERAALLRVVCPDATCARILGLQTELQPYTTCPDCGVGVCTACRAAHEPGMTCAQHEDALPLADLARQQGWQRCTACRRYVQHAEGCWHMTCLCGTQFCYLCAARWKTCQCPQFAVPAEEGVPAPAAVEELAELVED
ncbi:hypothetical protein EXIGLDRAFT_624786 [Exidia glandulosa HHB12029]|uniref:RBR-type E3 ubiquitin transferase n=1 Tax=Exidia glandulosa HHB12029 TaxID=1314781 RepID=A0A165D9G6_EXIGL|nr:hypothetical protein EXIGLDRAFT_624786 [Exidia glandulosa HHB12029]